MRRKSAAAAKTGAAANESIAARASWTQKLQEEQGGNENALQSVRGGNDNALQSVRGGNDNALPSVREGNANALLSMRGGNENALQTAVRNESALQPQRISPGRIAHVNGRSDRWCSR